MTGSMRSRLDTSTRLQTAEKIDANYDDAS